MNKQMYIVIVWVQQIIFKAVGPFDYNSAIDYTDKISPGMTWEIIELDEVQP